MHISQEVSKMVWYSHFFNNFLHFSVIHTVKDFGLINEKEIDVFLEFSLIFYDPNDAGNWISVSSAFSQSTLNM